MTEDNGVSKEAPPTVAEFDSLVNALFDQREKIKKMNEALAVENQALDAMEQKLVLWLDQLKREKYQHPRGTIFMREMWRWNLPEGAENKEIFYRHLKDRGLFEQMATIHSSTYNAFLKAEWDAAKERGEGFDFKLPGVPEPKLYRALGTRSNS